MSTLTSPDGSRLQFELIDAMTYIYMSPVPQFGRPDIYIQLSEPVTNFPNGQFVVDDHGAYRYGWSQDIYWQVHAILKGVFDSGVLTDEKAAELSYMGTDLTDNYKLDGSAPGKPAGFSLY